MIILDKNSFEIGIDEVKNIKVLETIKDGKVIYKE